MAKKNKSPKLITCELTGKVFEYIGHGRPPKYSPEGRKIAAAKRRRTVYKNKREASGMPYNPRGTVAVPAV